MQNRMTIDDMAESKAEKRKTLYASIFDDYQE